MSAPGAEEKLMSKMEFIDPVGDTDAKRIPHMTTPT